MSTMEEKDTPRTRRSFAREFKADAVAMVLDEDRKIVDVAKAVVPTGHSAPISTVRSNSRWLSSAISRVGSFGGHRPTGVRGFMPKRNLVGGVRRTARS